MVKRSSLLGAALATLVLIVACTVFRGDGHPSLPYADDFAHNHASEWTAYGGTWSVRDGMVINRSDERGAKIVTGSPSWSDYHIEADFQMLGHGGEMGIIARVQDPGVGINVYRGIYAGMHAGDGRLILGVSNNDWIGVRPVRLAGGVHTGVWYHLDLIVVGCGISAGLTNPQTGQSIWSALQQPDCSATGRVGVRSLDTGGAWRSFKVTPATQADLDAAIIRAGSVEPAQYPSREDDYARMMVHSFGSLDSVVEAIMNPEGSASAQQAEATAPLRPVSALATIRPGDRVCIRAVVTLPEPLYVQDESGGVAVHLLNNGALNVGDEIELCGSPVAGHSSFFAATNARLLWDRTPVIPASITTTQAAAGLFDGSFVELSGVLTAKQKLENGTYLLDVEDMAQQFRVVVPQSLANSIPRDWRIGSMLRLRGVCTEPPAKYKDASFLLLAGNDSDITVLAGPPWNRGFRLYLMLILGALLVCAGWYLYVKMEQGRARAVLQERERLALEMHDTLAQSFAGVSFHLQSLRKGLVSQGELAPNLMQKLNTVCSMTAFTHRDASDRIALWHSSSQQGDVLDLLQQSLVSMLRGSHLPLKLERTGKPRPFSMATHKALLLVGRESIANALRHSKASHVTLKLVYEPSRALLVIQDDGEGYATDTTAHGLGLESMLARARQVGGQLEVVSTPGKGTVVTMSTPYGDRFSVIDRLRAWLRARGGAQPL